MNQYIVNIWTDGGVPVCQATPKATTVAKAVDRAMRVWEHQVDRRTRIALQQGQVIDIRVTRLLKKHEGTV